MIGKLHVAIRKIRWVLDPNRRMMQYAGLLQYKGDQTGRGLVLIQIDGLSHGHFQKAMARGCLPFLKNLKKNEHYQGRHHYSGIPSCTPSIQGELFYGVKQCVPAFKFRDHETGKIFLFYHSQAAGEIESRLRRQGEGLLHHGSSYSNIFRGGAEENAHFCVASVGWTAFFKAFKPSALTVFILLNLWSIVRMIFYLILEFLLALYDFLRGTVKGFGFRDELKFILSRLIVTIGLREFAVLGAKLDMTRGLPAIHVNFFGYDDQAHRRGPGSGFAYWALPGIDHAVKRIWKAAQNSLARDYEVWIYSDHGQEEVVPYPVENQMRIEKAVAGLFHQMMPDEAFGLAENGSERNIGCRPIKCGIASSASGPPRPPTLRRCDWATLGFGRARNDELIVAAQGPVGFIYPHRRLSDKEKDNIARALVHRINVPLVLTLIDKAVFGYTKEGRFRLPEESAQIVGDKHPYLADAGQELENLCRHPDAGTFVISGWRKGKRSLTFPHEYGSHAGPGPHETDGFAFLPKDIRLHAHGKKYLRPLILRNTALGFLRGDEKTFYGSDPLRPARHTLRVMTYNVHRCVGMDGKLSPERIARVIARHDPDIIALQELDGGRPRTQCLNQAKCIAELLDMEHHFHPVRMIEEEMFGNAVLSRYPMNIVRAGPLPRFRGHSFFEPRGVLWVEIRYLDTPIHLINTHLSFWSHEQRKQIEAICSPEWLGDPNCRGNVILCGDFNAMPHSPACRAVRRKLEDVQLGIERHKPLGTWFGHFPLGRIDHIFVSHNIGVLKVEVPNSRLEKSASDHLPLIAELRVKIPTRFADSSGRFGNLPRKENRGPVRSCHV